MLTFEEL